MSNHQIHTAAQKLLTKAQARVLAAIDRNQDIGDGWTEFTDARTNPTIERLKAGGFIQVERCDDVERGKPVHWYRARRLPFRAENAYAIHTLVGRWPHLGIERVSKFTRSQVREQITLWEGTGDSVTLDRFVLYIDILIGGHEYRTSVTEAGLIVH